MIETQFRNFRICFRHIFFDEVRGQILEALLAIREGYPTCPAHQWMRIEKLVSMPLVSARDLNPQIKIFKKHSGPRSEGQLGDGRRSSSSTLGLKSIFPPWTKPPAGTKSRTFWHWVWKLMISTLGIASGGKKKWICVTLGLENVKLTTNYASNVR